MSVSGVEAPDIWTTRRILDWTRSYFEERGVDSPRLCAELLLTHVLSVRRVDLYLDYERPMSISERDQYKVLVKKRTEGVPVQHLIGTQAFRYLELVVNGDVLIPRPETEVLVERVLGMVREGLPDEPGQYDGPLLSAVDVGTGSGALILSLAKEAKFLFSSLTGVDISPEALSVARQNAEKNGLSDIVQFREGDLLSGFSPDELDVVVSNPPYISSGDIPLLDVEVREHEPLTALDGGASGLEIIKRLVTEAESVLRAGGLLAIEIGANQGLAVMGMLSSDPWCGSELHKDLAGRDRVVLARRAFSNG